MTIPSSARHVTAVILLALAGLVVAVALGVLVARSVSHGVALGGADLGAGNNLVVEQASPGPAATTGVSAPAPTTGAPTATTPTGATSDQDGDNSSTGGTIPGRRDHDGDD